MDFAKNPPPSGQGVGARLRSLADETGFRDLAVLAGVAETEGVDSNRDAFSTRLMEVYRDTGSPQAFGLIYELNSRPFFLSILSRLRRHHYLLDPNDILQEVFVNIYRYPLRFKADKPMAFRNWAGTIIRNTILRFLRGVAKESRVEQVLDEMLEPADETSLSPQEKLIRSESAETCRRAWLLYLHLYLEEFNRLSPRERKTLHLVEVEGFSYREVSAEMGIKVENLKMVIFRARKKIIRNMQRYFEAGSRDSCKVALL